jgi:23S rRNA (pseudouridine1915-N3)-methyltransferase
LIFDRIKEEGTKRKCMKITLIYIGKTNEKYLESGIEKYVKRLKNYCRFEIIEIKDIKNFSGSADLLKKESVSILEKIKEDDYLIVLDENGEEMNSVSFSEFIEFCGNTSIKNVVFLIGGAFGIHPDIKVRAKKIISLSKMTFSHQMIRLFFTEQLYRAFTIIKNEKYHNP